MYVGIFFWLKIINFSFVESSDVIASFLAMTL